MLNEVDQAELDRLVAKLPARVAVTPGIGYDETEKTIVRLLAGKWKAVDIGALISRDEHSVRCHCERQKLSLRVTGENHKSAKLSNLQVEMIRALYECGFKAAEIHQACFDHVHYTTVNDIKLFKTRLNG